MTSVLAIELTRSRLSATINEMTHLLHRSAYSTLMRESRDCSFTLLAPTGEVVVNGSGPFHGSSYRYLAQAILKRYPDLKAGDVYVSNHPYEAGIPHTPDLAVVVPAFVGDTLVGFSCSLAHKPDFGGSVVGSASMGATELYQEGLLLPPLLGWEGDRANEVLLQVIASNVRSPDVFFGDMRAQLGVTKLGAERLAGIARNVGVQTMIEVCAELIDQNSRALRKHIGSWPDGSVTVVGHLDSDGIDTDRPVRLSVTVTVAGDQLTVDFSDSADQTRGPVNMTPMFTDSAVFYSAIALTDPTLGFNDGIRRAIEIVRRPGSVLDPIAPAPVGAATSMQHRVMDLCLEAMGQFVPERSIAHSGGSGGTLGIAWQTDKAGARTLQYEVLGTAMGATYGADGVSGCTAYNTNLTVTPIEILETQFPVRLSRFELLRDSAGPGRRRGGLSYRRQYTALAPATVRRRAERAHFPGAGVLGGKPGSLARVWIRRADGTEEKVPVAGHYELAAGDVLSVEGSGAGGMGSPFERDPAAVLADVNRGYVSIGSARDDYGVVLTDAGDAVDTAATDALRDKLRAGAR